MEVVKSSLLPPPPPSPSSESEGENSFVSARATSTDQTQLLRQFDAAQRACLVQQVFPAIFQNRFCVVFHFACQEELAALRGVLSDKEYALDVLHPCLQLNRFCPCLLILKPHIIADPQPLTPYSLSFASSLLGNAMRSSGHWQNCNQPRSTRET